MAHKLGGGGGAPRMLGARGIGQNGSQGSMKLERGERLEFNFGM